MVLPGGTLATANAGHAVEGTFAVRHGAFLAPNGRILATVRAHRTPDGQDWRLSVANALLPRLQQHVHRFSDPTSPTVLQPDPDFVEATTISTAVDSHVAPFVPIGISYQLVEQNEAATAAGRDEELVAATEAVLGEPSAPRDIPWASLLPAESSLDQRGFIDYHKGCYLGQEVAARGKFRGVTRKLVLPVCVLGEGCGVAQPSTLGAFVPELLKVGQEEMPPPGTKFVVDGEGGAERGGVRRRTRRVRADAELLSSHDEYGVGSARVRLDALPCGISTPRDKISSVILRPLTKEEDPEKGIDSTVRLCVIAPQWWVGHQAHGEEE